MPGLFAVETSDRPPDGRRITARLATGGDGIELGTIFPCGSVTGAPKNAAMQALRELEGNRGGPIPGRMGWIEPGGEAAFNVLIRTLEWPTARNVRLGLGSGLVVDSIARDEWPDAC